MLALGLAQLLGTRGYWSEAIRSLLETKGRVVPQSVLRFKRLRFNGAGKDYKGNLHNDIKLFVSFVVCLDGGDTY